MRLCLSESHDAFMCALLSGVNGALRGATEYCKVPDLSCDEDPDLDILSLEAAGLDGCACETPYACRSRTALLCMLQF